MAKPRMDLSTFVGKLLEEQDGDVLREGVRVLAQALMETEVTSLVGAERHERSEDRTAYRNGSRMRSWDTRVGTVDLAIPKVRPGTYFPSLLQPRRRAEQALLTVVQEAYVHGVSTRKVDDLVKALGLDGLSKSEVSRICAELDPVVEAFRTRRLVGEHPYLWLDATYHKVRIDGRVVSQATVVAIGVTLDGERQILGVDVGASEDRAFWTAFLRSLVKRGLAGVRLVISDAHEGLKHAIGTVLNGATWQRCRVHLCGICWRRCRTARASRLPRWSGRSSRSPITRAPWCSSARWPMASGPACHRRRRCSRRPRRTSSRTSTFPRSTAVSCTAPIRLSG
jgi:putative transposase